MRTSNYFGNHGQPMHLRARSTVEMNDMVALTLAIELLFTAPSAELSAEYMSLFHSLSSRLNRRQIELCKMAALDNLYYS